MALADPMTEWPSEEIKYCHSYKTWNLAQDAAKKQARQEDTVSSEANCGRGRRTKYKAKRSLDSSSDSGCENASATPQPKISKGGKETKKYSRLISAPLANLEAAPSTDKIKALLTKKQLGTKPAKPGQSRFIAPIKSTIQPVVTEVQATSVLKAREVCFGINQVKDNPKSTSLASSQEISDIVGSPSASGTIDDDDSLIQSYNLNDDNGSEEYESPHRFSRSPVPSVDVSPSNSANFETSFGMKSSSSSSKFAPKSPPSKSAAKSPPSKSMPKSSSVGTSTGIKKSIPSIARKIKDLKTSRDRETVIVAEILEEMNSKMDIQGMNIAKILQCVDPEEAVIERPLGLPSLPLADEAAFNQFEKFLDVPTNSTATSLYLSGKLFDQTVPYKGAQKLLRSLISNSLARTISWEGTHGLKIAFNNTKCSEVLLSAILRRFSEKHMGLVKQKIKKWFDNSQGRKVSVAVRDTHNESSSEEV